jgi:hypothetical protein
MLGGDYLRYITSAARRCVEYVEMLLYEQLEAAVGKVLRAYPSQALRAYPLQVLRAHPSHVLRAHPYQNSVLAHHWCSVFTHLKYSVLITQLRAHTS